MAQTPWLDEHGALREMARFTTLLGFGAPKLVDRLVSRYDRGLQLVRASGYAMWPDRPEHPLAPGLHAYRKALTQTAAIQVWRDLLPFAQIAFAVNAFESDWQGHEHWLSRRLQDPKNCLQTLHEFLTALHLRSEGYNVEYVAAKREGQGGADLLVQLDGHAIVVECVLADADAGRPIPFDSAEWLWLQISEFMAKRDMHRVVLVDRDQVLAPTDKAGLLDEVRRCLETTQLGRVRFSGGNEVEILDGGSPTSPLRQAQIDEIRARLAESPLRWAVSRPLSRVVVLAEQYSLMRGFSIRTALTDRAIDQLAAAKARGRGQLKRGDINLIVAGFGRAIPRRPDLLQAFGIRLQQALMPHFRSRSRVSAVALAFRTEWDWTRTDIPNMPSTNFEAGITTYLWRNDHQDAVPLPARFRWPSAGPA